MMKKTFVTRLRKLNFRIVLLVLLLFIASFVTFIILGYYAALKPMSYLPKYNADIFKSSLSQTKLVKVATPWYVLLVDEHGKVTVTTPKGEIIMSDLKYYASYDSSEDTWGLNNISVKLSDDSTILITGKGALDVLVSLSLNVHKDIPKMDVNIRTLYSMNTIIHREALVAAFDIPVSEVYLKNRQVDVKFIDPEYWLQRQGVHFGNGFRSALIYHTPSVSSLQLDSKNNLLFVNLDYYLDHPQIHIPFQKDGGGRWINISSAKYSAGDKRNNNFSFYFGGFPKVTPRIMLVPNGYLAGYVFTEHADGATIRTHRAVYFGSEDITNINDVVGGFVGHRIPVTKSVFYAEPGDPRDATIMDDPDRPQFLDYLDQLNATGLYDICLHTPDDLNSNRKRLAESIKFMKERFNTVTWIDHGIYSGKVNRECLVGDGLNPDSRYFASDLWERYNTRYFWNPYDEFDHRVSIKEEIKKLRLYDASVKLWRRYLPPRELKQRGFFNDFRELLRRNSFKSELNLLKPYNGDSYPTPLYWQNPTRTMHFYSWVTNGGENYSTFSTRKAEIQLSTEQILIDKLITDWGIYIDHGYYARVRSHHNDDGVWCESNRKIVINPYFDKLLEFMARLRDKGDLCITTIRDLLNYWTMTDNISFDYLPNGIIRVFNNNNEAIKGLSLVVCANNVQVNGQIPPCRKIGNETIFWFDISAKEYVSIKVES